MSGIADFDRIATSNFPAIDTQFFREIVHHRFVRDRRLRHTESAKRAGRRIVSEYRFACGARMRHKVRPRRMHRHAVRHCWPPARISTGIEHRIGFRELQLALRIGAEANFDIRRMALGA